METHEYPPRVNQSASCTLLVIKSSDFVAEQETSVYVIRFISLSLNHDHLMSIGKYFTMVISLVNRSFVLMVLFNGRSGPILSVCAVSLWCGYLLSHSRPLPNFDLLYTMRLHHEMPINILVGVLTHY